MNLSEPELLALIAQGEGRGLEFKRGLPRDEKLARTLCAFANTRGGWLLVGVNDNGSLHLCPRPREVMADIRRVASELLSPALSLEVTTVKCPSGTIVAAHVNVSLARPHCLLDGPRKAEIVVRVGSSNRTARGATLDALHAGRNQHGTCDALESRVLKWIEERARFGAMPGGDATPARFGQAQNIGVQRARKAFERLERNGLLVSHGMGTNKIYALP